MSKATVSTHPRLITPTGTLDWPYLTRPDTEYNPAGEYKTKIKFPEDDRGAQQFVQQLTDIAEDAYKKACAEVKAGGRPPKRADLPFFVSGGQITVSAKLKASGVRNATGEGFTQTPRLEDAAGAPWDVNKAIWSGSIARLLVEVVPFNVPATGCGISLRLRAAQVIKLAERGQAQGSIFGATPEAAEGLLPASVFDESDPGDF